MQIIKSKIFEQFPIIFGFSTKNDTNLNDNFHFNMSFSVGNNQQVVQKNRKMFLRELDISINRLAYQKQIHSNIVKFVNQTGFSGDSDALITNIPNLAIAAFSADCTTIFIYDKTQNLIAAIHSGWRGTKQKIVELTINKMKYDFSSNPNDMFCFIAPAISQNNYIVGLEVAQYFEEKYLIQNADKYLLDVSLANFDLLLKCGVPENNIEFSELCSFQQPFLHSYRRDKEFSGRAIGVIMLGK